MTISSKMPYPTISIYGSTKSFIRFFTRALRFEMKPFGIHVTCLMPGATATSLYDTDDLPLNQLMSFGLMKRPETAAKSGVEALFKIRSVSIPGIFNKMVMMFIPFIPGILIDMIYQKKLKRESN